MSRRNLGFSLLEVLFGVTLLSLVLAISIIALRGTPDRISVDSAATRVVALMEESASLARAKGVPVAVGLPGDGPTHELVRWVGQPAKVEGSYDLSTDCPGLVLTTGKQGGLAPGPLGLRSGGFDVELWSREFSDVRLLIFLPSGEVFGRGVPFWEGSYRLLISLGLEEKGGVPVRVSLPQTVTVSSLGQVRQSSGAGAAFGTPEVVTGPIGVDQTAVCSYSARNEKGAPIVDSVRLLPDPTRLNLPPGIDAKVAPGGYLTLLVEATSPAGSALFCQWVDEDGGGLSSQTPQLMDYDSVSGHWLSRWHWRPPDSPRGNYRLRCLVTDEEGRFARKESRATINVAISLSKRRLLFGSDDRFGKGTSLLTMLEDGTDARRLAEPPLGMSDWVGGWSPDGSRALFTSNRTGNGDELFIVNSNGRDMRRVTQLNAGGVGNPEWSPTGSRVAFTTYSEGQREIWIVNADGSELRNLTEEFEGKANLEKWKGNVNLGVWRGGGYLQATWSPDERYILFFAGASFREAWLFDLEEKALHKVSGSRSIEHGAWSPNQARLALLGDSEIYLYPLDGSWPNEPVPVSKGAQAERALQFSPDGTRILFLAQGSLALLHLESSNDPARNRVESITIGGADQCPAWLDDETISFSRQLPGNREIFTLRLGLNHSLNNLTNHGTNDWFYGWASATLESD